MSFAPADFPGFGGLNLAADSEDSPGAIDLSNVSLSQPGPSRLMPRPGYTLMGSTDLSAMTAIAYFSDYLAVAGGTNLYLMDVGTGALRASKTDFTTGNPWTVVPFGSLASPPTVTNGGFETNTTGWTATTSTITRDTGVKRTGTASGRWDNTGASDALGGSDALAGAIFSGTFYAGLPYTLIVWARADASTLASIAFGTSTDYASLSSTSVSTSFDVYAIQWTPAATVDASTVSLRFTPSAGRYYYIDDVSLTQLGLGYGANGVALGRLVDAASVDEPAAFTRAAGATSFSYAEAPKPLTLAVQPKDNRLVAWGFDGSNLGPNQQVSSASHAYFSQPDNPEAWDETDYVTLSSGDGETGRAACTYNDFLFLFKQSKFFVFYGNSVDSTGGTVFNYRTVGNAFGGSSGDIYQGQVCSAPSGVYVITDSGVWKTTGGAPALVSAALSPLFRQNVNSLAYAGTGYTKLAPRSAMGTGGSFWHQGKVYFSVTITRGASTTSQGWIVLDEQSGQWVVWEMADSPRVGCSSPFDGATFVSGLSTTGRKGLLSMTGTATTDNGTAIASYYTAPYLAYGEPKAEKHVRASELHGTGTVTLAWGKDLQTHGTAETVAMSSGVGHARTGARGRVLSFKIAASAAGWTVNRVVPLLQSVRTGR